MQKKLTTICGLADCIMRTWLLLGIFLAASGLSAKVPPPEERNVLDPAKVEALIKQGAGVNDRNAQGFTWLHYASRAGTPEVIALLIKKGADPNAQDSARWSPLFMAGSGPNAAALLAGGADPNLQDKQGRTAVHAMLPLDQKETADDTKVHLAVLAVIVKTKRYDPYKTDSDGQAALEWALLQKNLEYAKIMLKAGFDLARYKNSNGMTMLEHFIAFSEADVVKFLLENGANPNVRTKHGMPILHFAVMNGNEEAVSLLLNHGADPNARDAAGQTAHAVAQDDRMKALLQKKGARK